MSLDLIYALDQLEKEKGIEKEILFQAIEAALISAYRKNFNSQQNIKVTVDRTNGNMRVFALKTVTSDLKDETVEISLENAKKIDAIYEYGDVVEIEITTGKFGRIAAQTAKQVVVQRIREAERDIVYNEFISKEGEVVTGIVQRNDRKNVIVDLGKTEGILPHEEQVVGERYNFNERFKFYVLEVQKTSKGPKVTLSRTHPGLVKKLFEMEVPEISDGTIEIKSISREAGSRTKIAVYSKNSDVDPVGACVGQRGIRVQAIVDKLGGEKIDIIKWDLDMKEYIASSISPAKVVRVDISDEDKSAKVTVPDFQLSLAIGKDGQNARLAAKLTGWKIDIKSESQLRATIEQQLLNFGVSNKEDEDQQSDEDKKDDGISDFENLFK